MTEKMNRTATGPHSILLAAPWRARFTRISLLVVIAISHPGQPAAAGVSLGQAKAGGRVQ